jgi:hypothetical protein
MSYSPATNAPVTMTTALRDPAGTSPPWVVALTTPAV